MKKNRELLTHKRLFRSTRLMFDVALASVIWQREIKDILRQFTGFGFFF